MQNPTAFSDIYGLEVWMLCRPISDWRVSWLGLMHCAVFVWHWEEVCGVKKRIVDAQYSFAGGRHPLDNPNAETYRRDRRAFEYPGAPNFPYRIAPPAGMSQNQFDQAVRNAGDNYQLPAPYDARHGPNSNTAADDIIERAGGEAPNNPFAPNQNWGEK